MRRGHVQLAAFAPGSSEVAVGFSGLFASSVQNLPQLCTHTVIFSPTQFLCILWLEERCVQVPALQQRGPGPRLAHSHRLVEVPGRHPQVRHILRRAEALATE